MIGFSQWIGFGFGTLISIDINRVTAVKSLKEFRKKLERH